LKKTEIAKKNRREFLRAIPAAAAAITIPNLLPVLAEAQNAIPLAQQNAFPLSKEDYELVRGEKLDSLAEDLKLAGANAGTKRLYNDKNFVLDLWHEQATGPREFEWHERRDHIVLVLERSTDYEFGGTAHKAHSIGPGEWLAPASEGATKLRLKKGDTLIIRRGTPHRRTTTESVTFTIASPTTPLDN
jgi:hypothetical protein